MIRFKDEVIDGEIAGGDIGDKCEVVGSGLRWRRLSFSAWGSSCEGGEESKGAQNGGG